MNGRPDFRNHRWLADGLILLVIAFALRAPAIGLSEIDWDESNFSLVAREILRGHWPYTAVFDHKPIALYLHYAGALALFGDNPTAVRMLGILTAASAALLVRSITTRRLGLSRRWGLFLAACYLLATLGFGGQATYSEHLVNLYVLLSAFLISSERWPGVMLSGIAAGIAININYLAIPVLVGMLAGTFAAIDASRRWETLRPLIFATGAIIAIALVLLPVLLFSNLHSYFALQLRFLVGYSADRSILGGLADFAVQAAPFAPLVATAGALAYFERGQRDPPRFHYSWLFAGMGLGSAVAALASGYVFPHYLLLAVPPAFLVVASLAGRATAELRAVAAAVIGGSALAMAVPGLVQAALGARNLVREATGEVGDVPRNLASIARPRLPPGSTIYSVCAPLVLYQLLDAEPPTRYPFDWFLLKPQYASALWIDTDRELAAIFAKRPAVVVFGEYGKCWEIPRGSWEKVRRSLHRNGYAPFATYDGYYFLAPASHPRTADTR